MLGRFRSAIYNAIGSVDVEPGTAADPSSLVDTGRSGKVSQKDIHKIANNALMI